MAKFFTQLNAPHMDFIRAQRVFFTASATASGRINLSPKGLQTFEILDPATVAYLDLTGSGVETSAHLLADGRLTFMFCSFDETPLILRLYGRGRLARPGEAAWAELYARFPPLPGARQIVLMDIESVQTSCGFGVPHYAYQGEREDLVNWAERKGEAGLSEYRAQNNHSSIDGLPAGLAPRATD